MIAPEQAVDRARAVRDQLPAGGLFAGLTWRIAPAAFPLSVELVSKLETLGGQLLAFYRACNTLYRHSLAGNVTPPPKPQLEEKMWFAFLWLEQLQPFWREQLGPETLAELRRVFPRTWLMDATPLPPHAVIPELGINDWRALGKFSQKQRELVLKISGFHEHAWGARSVSVGHDLPAAEWSAAVEHALASFPAHPFILQRFEKSKLAPAEYFDFEANELRQFAGRVRLCPYYFVTGDTAKLGGVLATICPANKKVLHGMTDAVLAPCCLPV